MEERHLEEQIGEQIGGADWGSRLGEQPWRERERWSEKGGTVDERGLMRDQRGMLRRRDVWVEKERCLGREGERRERGGGR